MMSKYLLTVITFGMTFFYGCGENKIEKEKKIVNTGIVKNYPQTTIGRAFEAAFDNAKWTWHEKNGKTYLRFTGKISKKLHDYAMLHIKADDLKNIESTCGLNDKENQKYNDKTSNIKLVFCNKYNKIVKHLPARSLILMREIQEYQKQFKAILKMQYKTIKNKFDKINRYLIKKRKKGSIASISKRNKGSRLRKEYISFLQFIARGKGGSVDDVHDWFLKDNFRAISISKNNRLFTDFAKCTENKLHKYKSIWLKGGSSHSSTWLQNKYGNGIWSSDDHDLFGFVNYCRGQVVKTINMNPKLKALRDKIIKCVAKAKLVDFVVYDLESKDDYYNPFSKKIKGLQIENEILYKKTKDDSFYKEMKDIFDNFKSIDQEKNTAISICHDDKIKTLADINEKYIEEFWKLNSDVTFEFVLYADRKTFELVKFNNDSWYKFKLSSVAVMNVIYAL